MDFPSDTTINYNKATFWYLYYNKQMAVLGGSLHIYQYLEFLSSRPSPADSVFTVAVLQFKK
jgi:hypothetical protein